MHNQKNATWMSYLTMDSIKFETNYETFVATSQFSLTWMLQIAASTHQPRIELEGCCFCKIHGRGINLILQNSVCGSETMRRALLSKNGETVRVEKLLQLH